MNDNHITTTVHHKYRTNVEPAEYFDRSSSSSIESGVPRTEDFLALVKVTPAIFLYF